MIDLVSEMTGLVIATELAQRGLVQMGQNVAQFIGRGITGGKTLSVNLAQRADEGVAVLVADFAVVIAVAIVEACLAHAALPGALGRQLPPAAAKWQPRRIRNATAAFWEMPGAGPGNAVRIDPDSVGNGLRIERQRSLAFVPVDDVEQHAALEHFSLEVGGMLLPVRGISHPESGFLALPFQRVVGAQRAANGLIHRDKAIVGERAIVHSQPRCDLAMALTSRAAT